MRSLRWMPLVVLLLLAACQSAYRGVLILEGEHRFDAPIEGDLVMLQGSVVLGEGADLSGSAYVLSGALQVDDAVGGDVLAYDGLLTLGPSAHVTGDVLVGAGEISRAPGATIGGRSGQGLEIPLPAAMSGGGESGGRSLAAALRQALFFAAFGLVIARFMARPVRRIEQAVRKHAVVCAAIGALSGIAALVLLVQMAFTVVLLPVTMLGMLLLFFAGAYGLISPGVQWGQALGARFAPRVPRLLLAAAGGAATALLLELLNRLPYIGGALSLLVLATGFGAALLTRFGWVEYRPVEDRHLL